MEVTISAEACNFLPKLVTFLLIDEEMRKHSGEEI